MIDYRSIVRAEQHPRAVVKIAVDGVPLTPILQTRLISLTHTDNRGFEPDTVDLELDDSDGKLAIPPRGAVLDLAFGWKEDGLVKKGSYTVAEVAHSGAPDKLSIRATSADMAAGLTTQRERPWHDITVGAIVLTIAEENGLLPHVPDSLANQKIDHIDQTNESSANFLTRLAAMFDAIATVKSGFLLFIPAASGRTASGQPIPAVTITRSSGDQHSFMIADRVTYEGVRARYHDMDAGVKGEVVWGGTEDGAERGVQPKQPDPPPVGQYKTLPSTYKRRDKALRAAKKAWAAVKKNKAQRAAYIGVKAKYDDRNLKASGEVAYGQVDDEKAIKNAQKTAERDAEKIAAADEKPANAFERTADNVKTLRHVYANKTNALRAARTEWRRLQRGMASFQIDLARGLPELFPETPVSVSGFKPQIDSTSWIVIRVTNTLDGDGGYRQRVELEIKATEVAD